MPRLSVEERFWAKVDKSEDCWLWLGARWGGGNAYGCFAVAHHEDVSAHRWAYEQQVGPIPEGMKVLHHCDTPLCVRGAHLFLGDDAVNMADKTQKGRQARGERFKSAKLTEEQVRDIRARFTPYDEKNGGSAMAREFGVSQAVISSVALGKTWKHVA